MPYNKEIIFQELKEAREYYEQFGFVLTEEGRLILNRKVEIEIQLRRIGPALYRSRVNIKEIDD